LVEDLVVQAVLIARFATRDGGTNRRRNADRVVVGRELSTYCCITICGFSPGVLVSTWTEIFELPLDTVSRPFELFESVPPGGSGTYTWWPRSIAPAGITNGAVVGGDGAVVDVADVADVDVADVDVADAEGAVVARGAAVAVGAAVVGNTNGGNVAPRRVGSVRAIRARGSRWSWEPSRRLGPVGSRFHGSRCRHRRRRPPPQRRTRRRASACWTASVETEARIEAAAAATGAAGRWRNREEEKEEEEERNLSRRARYGTAVPVAYHRAAGSLTHGPSQSPEVRWR
jgi:hypothetical protein